MQESSKYAHYSKENAGGVKIPSQAQVSENDYINGYFLHVFELN